jgi:ribosomal protein S12 methylthiotransferase
VREGEMLVRGGAKELVLIAQDTTRYGQDVYGRKMLAPLLRRLSAIDGVIWLRVMYTHPAHFTDDLIGELAGNPRVVKYVDLPLQHIADSVLQRMNRPNTRGEVEALLARLQGIPGMAIRTTFITGFPGETETEFRELCEFVREGHFAHLGCFAYSPEPGAPAFRMRQLPPEVREARAQEVMKLQHRVALRRNRRRIGEKLTVLVDTPGKTQGEFLGRTSADAPEVDDVVHLVGDEVSVGQFVTARVARATAYDLFVSRVRGPRP